MNACFDVKLLHISCNNSCIFELNAYCMQNPVFTVCCLRAENTRRETDPAAPAHIIVYSRNSRCGSARTMICRFTNGEFARVALTTHGHRVG
jgi:hypothetical protein